MSAVLASNPYVGLRPYEADESLLFFGRRQQVSELLRRLGERRFLAVVGSSGCGKSSLVRAGLIPVLRAGFLVAERDEWRVAQMKPGAAPLHGLVEALAGLAADANKLRGQIEERGVEALLQALAAPLGADANLLLLVDQFEEIFRYGRTGADWSQRDEAASFVALLIELASQRRLPIYVVLTMRSDFLGDCDLFPGLPEALNNGQYLVPRLSREQRRDAIEGPARLYRRQIAPRLTDRLLNETFDTRDDLPVLQHALLRTWDRSQGDAQGPIDVVHYEDIGTVREALSRDADAAMAGMDAQEQLLTKRLFQALTTLDATNRGTRRPARLHTIAARCGVMPSRVWAIVERFCSDGRSFLVASSSDVDANPTIDISHESLIRQWGRLGQWVEEEQESIKTYRRLADRARQYAHHEAGLYSHEELQAALEWLLRESPNAAWAQDLGEDFDAAMAFLRRSRAEQEFERRWKWLRFGLIVLVAALLGASFMVPAPGFKESWEGAQSQFADLFKADDNARLSREDMAKAVVDMLRIVVHGMLLAGLLWSAKWAYRRLAFEHIRGTVDLQSSMLQLHLTPANMKLRFRSAFRKTVERVAKWTCIVAGVGVLATCSSLSLGYKSGGTSLIILLIGVVTALVLVGWVAAVARINAEMAQLREQVQAVSEMTPPPSDAVVTPQTMATQAEQPRTVVQPGESGA